MKNKDWKNKIRDHAPEVNQNFWPEIEQHLPLKKRSRVVLPLLLLALLFISIITAILYNGSNDSNKATMAIQKVEQKSIKLKQESNQISKQKTKNALKQQAKVAPNEVLEIETFKSDDKRREVMNSQENPELIEAKNIAFEKNYKPQTSKSTNTAIAFNSNKAPFAESNSSIQLTLYKLHKIGIGASSLPMLRRKPESVPFDKIPEMAKKSDKERAINLYFNTSLFSAYHKINPNLLDDKVIKYIDNPAFSWDRLGVKLSAGISKDLSEKLNIYLGISYLQQAQTIKYGYEITSNTSLMIDALQQNTIQITPNKEIQEEVIQVKNQSIGFHTGLAYTLVQRANYSQAIDIQVDWQHQMGDKAFFGPDQFYINLAYNNLYQLNQWLSFKVSPVISYTVNEFAGQSDNSLSLKPYSLGLDFGLTIHLRH